MKIVRKSTNKGRDAQDPTSVFDRKGCDYIHVSDIQNISPSEYEKMKVSDDLLLLDVREQYEYEQTNLGGKHIPLSMIFSFSEELPSNKTIVVHCKSGKRSLVAIQILEELGFDKLLNLQGGINAYLEFKNQTT